jgi:DNA (cytosine-5)-methyltransferase 1
MYLETKYGWYVLEEPSERYKPFFQDFWFKHKITYFLLSESLRNPTINKDQFSVLLALHDEYPPSVLQRLVDGIDDEDVVCLCAIDL